MNTHVAIGLVASIALTASATARAQQDPFPLPPKDWPSPVMDTQPFTFIVVDRLEHRSQAGPNLRVWDAQGWFGGDRDRVWLKTEGENEAGGRTEQADAQLLYARRIAPFWHLQAGARRDWRSGSGRNAAVMGLQGIAPYWFNVEAMLFLDRRGLSGRVEVEYDLLLAQRLILQPRFETRFAGYTDRERDAGSGIRDVELGLRLRYEIRREFAPYIGINWTRSLGETATLARSRGEDVRAASFVIGLRVWY